MNIINNINNNYILTTQENYNVSINILKINKLQKIVYSLFQNNTNNIVKKSIFIEETSYSNHNETISINFLCKKEDSYFIFVELIYKDTVVNCYEQYSCSNNTIIENIKYNITNKLKNKNSEQQDDTSINLKKLNNDQIISTLENEYESIYLCTSESVEEEDSEDEEEESEDDEEEEEEDNSEEEEEDDDNDNDDDDDDSDSELNVIDNNKNKTEDNIQLIWK